MKADRISVVVSQCRFPGEKDTERDTASKVNRSSLIRPATASGIRSRSSAGPGHENQSSAILGGMTPRQGWLDSRFVTIPRTRPACFQPGQHSGIRRPDHFRTSRALHEGQRVTSLLSSLLPHKPHVHLMLIREPMISKMIPATIPIGKKKNKAINPAS